MQRRGANSSELHKIAVIILAAGRGKRLGGEQAKATIATEDAPLLQHVLSAASTLHATHTVVVTGYKREIVERCATEGAKAGRYSSQGITFAEQVQLLGTGDAVRAAMPKLSSFVGHVIILCGDVPLIRSETLSRLVEHHDSSRSTVTVLSSYQPLPNSYGRIVRASDGKHVEKIVEARDCSSAELQIGEINTGIYVVESSFLGPALEKLENNNTQKEFYLTDIVAIAVKEGQTVSALVLNDPTEALGVNTLEDLAAINKTLRQRKIAQFLAAGVKFVDPESVYIDDSVTIGAETKIGPAVQLRGKTTIGSGVTIEGTALLVDCQIADEAIIKLGVRAEGSTIGTAATVGPFAHLRPGTNLGAEVKIGNFVETKKAKLEAGAKASHLTYLGDCTVGADANIGAGTITCNYDGYQKYETKIGAGAFIGSNTALVAPVTVGVGATVGAGSVITKDVSADALAFTRPPQEEKVGWSRRKRATMEAKRSKK